MLCKVFIFHVYIKALSFILYKYIHVKHNLLLTYDFII